MTREIITVSVGQAGIQMGSSVWQQYMTEHNIDYKDNNTATPNDNSFLCFFEETQNSTYTARNLMVDLEPNVIDDIKLNPYSKYIFDSNYLLYGKEDASNVFNRGHYTVGKEMIDIVNDRLRILVEKCNNLQGFILNHAIGGGTGSGLGCLILERMAVDYRKKSKISFSVFPSYSFSTATVEPYNALLTTHWLLDHTEITVVLDNEALYEICQNNLNILNTDYNNINKLCAKLVSSITTSLRFGGDLHNDLNEFQTNLVAFPRLHFMTTSIAPIVTPIKYITLNKDVSNITDYCFKSENYFVKVDDFDNNTDLFMAISLQYRGNVNAKNVNTAVQKLKTNKKVSFVQWCPTGFKVGVSNKKLNTLVDDDIAYSDINCSMIGNNTCISRVFAERISQKVDKLLAQRAFLHWYVSEGPSYELWEAREDLGFLEKDYLDVLSDQTTDYDDTDTDDYYDDTDTDDYDEDTDLIEQLCNV